MENSDKYRESSEQSPNNSEDISKTFGKIKKKKHEIFHFIINDLTIKIKITDISCNKLFEKLWGWKRTDS